MKVTTYESNQVQTQVSAQPMAQSAPAGAFGGAVTSGLQQLGDAALQMNERIATTEAEEALVQFERDKNDVLFNPEKGYFNSQGRDAFDGAQPTVKSIEELKTKYSDSLSQSARTLFDKAAGNHVTRAQLEINRHAAQGFKAWEVSTLEAQVENTIESASLYWNDSNAMKLQNVIGRQAITDAAKMQGLSAEATNERLQTYDSSFARAAVEAATMTSATKGKELLSEFDKRLEGQDKIKLQSMIASKGAAEKTKADASYALIKSKQIIDQYDDRESIITEVNKINDPDMRDKVMSQSMHDFNLRKQAQTEARTQAYEAAESHVLSGGSAESFQAADPESWMRLSPKQQSLIKSGKANATDWSTFSDLMTMPKDQLAKIDPNDYADKLAPPERNKLITAVKGAKNAGGGDAVDSQVGRTRIAQTTAAVDQLFGPTSKRNDERKQQANAFYSMLDSEVTAREQEKGSKLTSEEYTNVLNGFTRKVVVDGVLWDSEKTIKDIPAEDVSTLSTFLRDNKIPVTADNLLKAYQQATK